MWILDKREIRKKNDNNGQITVFLSLLLTCILLFMMTCCEGVHIYLGKGRAARTLVSAQESVMADYNRFLWEQYHILAVDETYGSGNQDAMKQKLQEYYLEQSDGASDSGKMELFAFGIEEFDVSNVDYLSENVDILRNEIREYMKYEVAQDSLETLWEQVQPQSPNADVESARQQVETSDANAKAAQETDAQDSAKTQGESSASEGVKVQGDDDASEETTTRNTADTSSDTTAQTEDRNSADTVEDPRDTLKDFLKVGIVELVTKRNDISSTPYITKEVSETSEDDSEKTAVTFEDAEDVTTRLSLSENVEHLSNELVTELLAVTYAAEYFPNVSSHLDNYNCQMEYLVAGKDNDYDNVKSVIYRIIAIRFPVNFAYVVKSPAKQAQAKEVAAAIAGISANPAVVELVSYLLMACESYAESVLDVRALVAGEKVEFLKNDSNWHLNLANMAQSLNDTNTYGSDSGMTYEDYLKMLLLLQSDKDIKYKRMLQLMDVMGRLNREDFAIENMVFGFQVTAKIRLKSMFAGLPLVGMKGGEYELTKVASY